MTYFTPLIDKYFARWILADTWHTNDQSDMDRFWLFIYAIDRISRAITVETLSLDDPTLEKYPKRLRPRFAKVKAPNPRTYKAGELKRKILLALERNYEGFDPDYAEEHISGLVEKAMIVLEALRAVRELRYPNESVRKWNPPLK